MDLEPLPRYKYDTAKIYPAHAIAVYSSYNHHYTEDKVGSGDKEDNEEYRYRRALYLLSREGRGEHYDAVEKIYNNTVTFRTAYACKELSMGIDIAYLATMGPCTYGRDFPSLEEGGGGGGGGEEEGEGGKKEDNDHILLLVNSIIDLFVAMYPALITSSPYAWEKFCFHIFRFVNWSLNESASAFDIGRSAYWEHSETTRDMCAILASKGPVKTWPRTDWERRAGHTQKLLLKCDLKNCGSDYLLSALEFRSFEFEVQHRIDSIRTTPFVVHS